MKECKCHCHNDHEGAGLSNPEMHCKCLPNCEHCNPIGFKNKEKEREENALREAFKSKIMNTILAQDFVIDIDDQIDCLQQVAKDLRKEWKRQVKENTQ